MNTAFVVAAALGSVRGAYPPAAPSEVSPMAALRRVNFSAVKPYAETLGGALIAFVGVALWLWPAV
jgi:hypothetical protein